MTKNKITRKTDIQTIVITAELPENLVEYFISTLESIQKADLYRNQLNLIFDKGDLQNAISKNKKEVALLPKDLQNPAVANTVRLFLKEYLLLCASGTKKPGKTDFIDNYCYEHGYKMKYASIRLSRVFQKMWVEEFNNYQTQRDNTHFDHHNMGN